MSLLSELIDGWDIAKLEKELDQIEESYRNLVRYTALFEGVLDNLPDEIIEKVAEIEKRLDAVARARELLSKLKKSGGYTPEQVKKMRGRVTRNASKLKKLLDSTKKQLETVGKRVEKEVEEVKKEEGGNTTGSFDLRNLDREHVNVLRKISSGRFDQDRMDDLEAIDILSDLHHYGLIGKDDKITAKGKKALADLRASIQDRRSAADKAKQNRLDREELSDV